MRRGVGYLFLTAAILGIAAFCWQQREPRYQGRTLTSWLQLCTEVPDGETHQPPEALAAIRAIGAKKAVPFLLKMAKAPDGAVRAWLIAQQQERDIRIFRLRSAWETRIMAAAGFQILGTNAAMAVPALERLLCDTNYSETSWDCLIAIGAPAQAIFCSALTNSDPRLRGFVAQNLAYVFDDTDALLNRLKGCLRDCDASVRWAAVGTIGTQTNAPEAAVQLLLLALQDEDGDVSSAAARALADFGTNACPALEALTDAARGEGMPGLEALRTLLAIAPDEALPIIVSRARSADAGWRFVTLELLYDCPFTNSVIQSVIEAATTDVDPNISRRAKEFITDQYRKNLPDEHLFPDEISHKGKRLGEWLGMPWNGYKFSDGAQEALQDMGTNAIPDLMRRLTYVRPPFGLPAEDVNTEAGCGLIVLGEKAKSVLPRLKQMMDGGDENAGLRALLASSNMGREAINCMTKGLTNQNAEVRREAADYLIRQVGDRYPEQRKEAIPLLQMLLNDPVESVRVDATNALSILESLDVAQARTK